MRRQFRDTLVELGDKDERTVLVFGDISVYLFNEFQNKHPDRFYNLGICENTLISVGAGLSSQGYIPFVHSIAPFVTERSFEQIKLDFCYNQYPGNIVSCGATFDYAWDGATHHCPTDIGALRLLPEMQVFQPGSKKETDFLIKKYYDCGKTNYFRLSDHCHDLDLEVQEGRGVVVKDVGADTTVVTAGPMLDYVMKATEGLNVNVLYFHTIKPFDSGLVAQYRDTKIKVVHDAHGLFEAVCESSGLSVEYLGLPDYFCCSYGTIEDVRRYAGLSVEDVKEFITTGKKARDEVSVLQG